MFSVVIPLYNKAHTIIRTLSTVLNQSFVEFEVIIINDGSTDNGVEIINNFSSDERIRIIDQENQGVSVARNNGVAYSKYEYIAFLDGDDEWLPEYLNKMKEAIELFPSSGMFCSAGMGRGANGFTKNREIEKYKNKIIEFDFFENPHVFLQISAVVVSKELFYKTNGFPQGMKRNEDFAFLYSAALIALPIYSGFTLSIYVGGVAGQATNNSIYENAELLRDIVNRFNIVYENWIDENCENQSFIVFMKYELRHYFMINSYSKEFVTNHFFLENLRPEISKQFNYFEKLLISTASLRIISIGYSIFTKLRWRSRGFQRVK